MRRTFFASGLRFLRQDDVMGQIKATVNKQPLLTMVWARQYLVHPSVHPSIHPHTLTGVHIQLPHWDWAHAAGVTYG